MGVSSGVWDISDSRAPQRQHVIFYEQFIFVYYAYFRFTDFLLSQ